MACFEDLDAALLEAILKWLNSTELRNSATLVCRRWKQACSNFAQQSLWRVLEIDIPWEICHPRGLDVQIHVIPWQSSRQRPPRSAGGRRCGRSAFPPRRRQAFLSKANVSRWLWPRAHRVQVLKISGTESFVRVVGQGLEPDPRHDLQPSDLVSLLAALPALTELHLDSACDLLPDPAVLLQPLPPTRWPPPPPPPPPPSAQHLRQQETPSQHQHQHQHQNQNRPLLGVLDEQQQQQQAQYQESGFDRQPAAGWPAAGASTSAAASAPPPPASLPLPATPLPDRLLRLSLRRCTYDLQSDEGRAGAAALGSLRSLTELVLSMFEPTELGLSRLPDTWSQLTGLTALRLANHRHLRRLPSWFAACLGDLQQLELDGCGLRAMPVAALAGLPSLRVLNLNDCDIGRSSPPVCLDAWWPCQENEGPGRGGAARQGGPAHESGTRAEDGQQDAAAGGDGVAGSRGIGLRGLEVLRLRDCGILALPYAVSQLTQLRHLDLGGNPLGPVPLPDDFGGGMNHLRTSVYRYLRESGERGFQLLSSCSRLGHLGLAGCGLTEVPPPVLRLTQLTSLDLSGNPELVLSEHYREELRDNLPRLDHLSLEDAGARNRAWGGG